MSKLCRSCGEYYDGEYCEKCGYGDPNIKTKAANKYKKPTKPEKYRTDEEKELYAKWEKERRGDKVKAKRDPKAGLKTLIIVAIVAIAMVVLIFFKSGIIFKVNKTDVIEKYFKAIYTCNFDDFTQCQPDQVKKDYENDLKESGLSKDSYLKELYKDFREDYGDDYKINLKYGKQEKLDKSEYNMSAFKKQYGSVPNISEVWEIAVTVEFSGSKKTDTMNMYVRIAKCSGEWKILSLGE